MQRDELRDDRRRKRLGNRQRVDVTLGLAALLVVRVENCRPVLGSIVGTLPVQLGRIVRDREVHLKELPVRDLMRIVADLHRFGVARRPRTHNIVVRGQCRAAGEPRDDV